jgi:hypothetical protein
MLGKILRILFKVLIVCFSENNTTLAQNRALARAENEYAANGYDDSYMPCNVQPTAEDFSAVKKEYFL